MSLISNLMARLQQQQSLANDIQQTSFWPEMASIINGPGGWRGVGQLGDQGYWNKYADYDAAKWAPYIGPAIAAEESKDGGGGLSGVLSNPVNAVLGPVGFQLGGVSGASAATGNGVTPKTIAADAAGLAAGAGLSGSGLLSGAAGAGTAAADSAAPAALGGGITAGSTASGIGAGATGTGVTAGTTSSGIGGGAVGTGVTGAGTSLGTFGAESLYPVLGGATTAAAGGSGLGGASGAAGAGAAGAAAAGSGGGTAAGTGAGAGTALSRILDGTATTADYLSVLGTAGATGLGIFGSQQQANALRDIAAQGRADRAPFLNKSLEYLNDPSAYAAGPGATSLNSVLRALSVKGNPMGNPASLELATQAGLSDWRNAVTGFGNLGLAGEDTRASLLSKATGADANALNALGYGVGQITNPPTSLADILKQLKGTSSVSSLV